MTKAVIQDLAVATTILDVMSRGAARAVVVAKPLVEDGRIVDAEVVWVTDLVRQLADDVFPGARLADIAGGSDRIRRTVDAAEEALANPGRSAVRGPSVAVVDGQEHHFRVTAFALDDLVIVEYEDLTAQMREQAARLESEHRFRTLLEGLDAGVVVLQPVFGPDGALSDAVITWSNRTSQSMWINQEGLRPGTHVRDVYFDVDDWMAAAAAAWEGVPSRRMLHPQPGVATWTLAMETIHRIGDTLVELTVDRSHDRMLLDRLAEMDHRFAALVADLPLTVLVATVGQDELDFVSPNAVQLTGRPLDQLRTISAWTDLVHPDDQPAADEIVRAVASSGWYDGVVRYVRADDSVVWVNLRVARRVGPGERDGFITLISDVTEQQRLREKLATSDRLETLGRIAGSISHDFNNLLMIVAGNLERVRTRHGDSNPLSTATVATQRAADLATSLLSFAKGRPGQPRVIDVADRLRRFESIMRSVLDPRLRLELDLPPEALPVWADATHLEQIVLNLVTNARDASPDGATVTVRAHACQGALCHVLDDTAHGPHVAIEVTDRGSGIPAHVVGRIWEPFFSTRNGAEGSGSGLGLSTVHGLAHQHYGHVHLRTRVGAGTTVTVYLPSADTPLDPTGGTVRPETAR